MQATEIKKWPYCEPNLIELTWASVKGYVPKNNKEFTMTETKQLTIDGFKHTTPDMWRRFRSKRWYKSSRYTPQRIAMMKLKTVTMRSVKIRRAYLMMMIDISSTKQ